MSDSMPINFKLEQSIFNYDFVVSFINAVSFLVMLSISIYWDKFPIQILYFSLIRIPPLHILSDLPIKCCQLCFTMYLRLKLVINNLQAQIPFINFWTINFTNKMQPVYWNMLRQGYCYIKYVKPIPKIISVCVINFKCLKSLIYTLRLNFK